VEFSVVAVTGAETAELPAASQAPAVKACWPFARSVVSKENV
jgi:hypothetical protein